VPPTLFLCVVWTSFLVLAPATIMHSNTRIIYLYFECVTQTISAAVVSQDCIALRMVVS
jgi:hypothetical protein